MRGVFVTLVAVLVVGLSVMGLVDAERRYGPVDTTLRPAVVETIITGTYHLRGDTSVVGLCPSPPCDPTTSIDLRFEGLPPGMYAAALEGDERLPIGPLVADGDVRVLQWSKDEDHTDKRHLVIQFAERTIMSLALHAGEEPTTVEATFAASWGAMPAPVRLNEIGGFAVSTVAIARLAQAPPAGWTFHAWLEGETGIIDLGALAVEDGQAVLDGRVERVRLEDQRRIVVGIVASGGTPETGVFPILQAPI